MNSKVTVLADETTQAVVNISQNNPDYGYVRVQQIRTMIDDNGFLRRKPVSALIPATVEELQATGFFAGQQLDGKIVGIPTPDFGNFYFIRFRRWFIVFPYQ